jgi:hypothetical protein
MAAERINPSVELPFIREPPRGSRTFDPETKGSLLSRNGSPTLITHLPSNRFFSTLHITIQPSHIYNLISGCRVNGQQVSAESTVRVLEDPCVRCQCNSGRLSCSKKACPVLHCPPASVLKRPGDCCPTCTGKYILIHIIFSN